jgi:type II secretory pathway pseudopilin PulG
MLVVIAIVGLLSSVILVALGPSRTKAKDARIVSDMNQVRALMETAFNNGTYPTPNFAVDPWKSLQDDVKANNGNVNITIMGAGDTGSYAAYTTVSTGVYCVDSKGNAVSLSGSSGITAAGCK